MNIYQKLSKARVELQNMKLAKTGKNQSMTYFELGDFLPAVNSLCDKHEMTTHLSIVNDGAEKAILTLYNASEPQEKIEFVVPTAEAQLPRGQEIQNLGAKITYLRRYMLMTAFEIAESDIVDKVNRELREDVSSEDLDLIKVAKSIDELSALYEKLEKKYTSKVLLSHFSARRKDIEDEQELDQTKGVKK